MVEKGSRDRMTRLYEQMGGREAWKADVVAARQDRMAALFEKVYRNLQMGTPS